MTNDNPPIYKVTLAPTVPYHPGVGETPVPVSFPGLSMVPSQSH